MIRLVHKGKYNFLMILEFFGFLVKNCTNKLKKNQPLLIYLLSKCDPNCRFVSSVSNSNFKMAIFNINIYLLHSSMLLHARICTLRYMFIINVSVRFFCGL